MSGGFYDDPQKVEDYIELAKGYDGKDLIAILRRHLSAGSTVLELGMGPGVDLALLVEHYAVTGSDTSEIFLERYRSRHPGADLLRVDARAMDLPAGRRFDGIYSNKVLHQLTRAELAASLRAQASVLQPSGFAIHSFWVGEGDQVFKGQRFTYWTKASMEECLAAVPELSLVALGRLQEMEPEDTLYVLLRAPS